jgi:hypothetical protein
VAIPYFVSDVLGLLADEVDFFSELLEVAAEPPVSELEALLSPEVFDSDPSPAFDPFAAEPLELFA